MMKENFDFSIIITTYNNPTGAVKSIESALAQNYSSYEILLIDDGSNDSTPAVCNQYAEEHKNIRFFSQNNSGVSVSRNRGIEESCGKYLIFVDGDDLLLPNALREYANFLQGKSKKFDIIFSNFITRENNADFPHVPLNTVAEEISVSDNLQSILSCFFQGRGFPCSNLIVNSSAVPWAKCYRRDFLQQNSLLFNVSLRRVQDLEFNVRCIESAQYVGYMHKDTYVYMIIEGSLSHHYNPQLLHNYELVLDALYKDLHEIDDPLVWNDFYFYIHSTIPPILERSLKKQTVNNMVRTLKDCFALPCYRQAQKNINLSAQRPLKNKIRVFLCKRRAYYCYAVLRRIKLLLKDRNMSGRM